MKKALIIILVGISGCKQDKYRDFVQDSYLSTIRKEGSDIPIYDHTYLYQLYAKDGNEILFLWNLNPESQHETRFLVVMKNGHYAHEYSAETQDFCRVTGNVLRCPEHEDKREDSDIPLADIFAGKQILIDGQLSDAWRGGKNLSDAPKR